MNVPVREIGEDDPVRLSDAVSLFLGDTASVQTMNREARNGYLSVMRIAGKNFVTKTDIDNWAQTRGLSVGASLGTVYFVKCGDFIKIGVAENDLDRRLRNLQCANPLPLELIATCAGGYRKERAFHKQFAALRVRDEWFRFDGVLKEFVEGLK